MRRSINAVKARKNFGEIIEEVYYRGDQIIVERQGKPMAAVVPLAILEQWLKQREEDMGVFDEIWSKSQSTDEAQIEREVNQAITDVRRSKARSGKKSSGV